MATNGEHRQLPESSDTAYPKPRDLVQLDLLLAFGRVLSFIDIDESALAQIQAVSAEAQASGTSFQEVADHRSVPLTAPIVALMLFQCMHDWFDSGADMAGDAEEHLYLDHFALDEGKPQDRVAAGMIRVLAGLARLRHAPPLADQLVRSIAEELEAIGDTLVDASAWDPAVRCFDVCCNLVARVGEPAYVRCAEKALAHVRLIDDSRTAAGVKLKAACARVALAKQDETLALRAYDAVYDAMLELAGEPLLRAQVEPFFRECLSTPTFRALAPLFALSDPNLNRESLPEQWREIRPVPQITNQDVKEWMGELMTLRSALVEAENGRLALEARPPDPSLAEADWTTWAFSHPAYYRAIPDASSILRAPELGNLMMALVHEITHIFSMNGYIGLTVLAARTSIISLMFSLWERAPNDADEVLGRLPALQSHDALTLARAEQVLHLMRKLQIIREVWAPWFEGIAIYTELSDPLGDLDGYSPAMEVLQNLIDRVPDSRPETSLEDIEEMVKQLMRENEERYSDAIRRHGQDRLRAYLLTYHASYFVGYFAVRSIVSAWRNTLGEPLRAAVAARLLLHVTRSGTQDAVPDLSMPIEQFLEAATLAHTRWVEDLRKISGEDLRDAAQPYSSELALRYTSWVNGRLVRGTEADQVEFDREFFAYAERRAREGWNGLRGPRNGLDDECHKDDSAMLMIETAKALAAAAYNPRFAQLTLRRLVSQLSVLPVAKVEARFWLNCADKGVFCLLRTSESTGIGGTAGYNGVLFTLDDAEFEALLNEYKVSGASRMSVYRIADLAAAGALEGRGYGRQCLAMQCGKWLHIQMRGLIAGTTSDIPAIKDHVRLRCIGDAVTRFDRDVVGDGRSVARAVRDWIDRGKDWSMGKHDVSIDAWVQRVRRVCDEVLCEDSTQERRYVQAQILERVLGFSAQRVEVILKGGPRAFARPIPGAVAAIFDLIYRSADRPLTDTDVPTSAMDDLFASTRLGLDVRSPTTHRQ